MCIRDRFEALKDFSEVTHFTHYTVAHAHLGAYGFVTMIYFCLLYTSDAADERSSVDLGGRRIIKKTKTLYQMRSAQK